MRTYSWKALKECQDQHQLASQQSQPHRTLPPGFVDCHRHVSLSCHRTRLQCAFQARCPGTFGQLGLQHGLLIQKHLANYWWPLKGSENGITWVQFRWFIIIFALQAAFGYVPHFQTLVCQILDIHLSSPTICCIENLFGCIFRIF
jgi:hypothetical protein